MDAAVTVDKRLGEGTPNPFGRLRDFTAVSHSEEHHHQEIAAEAPKYRNMRAAFAWKRCQGLKPRHHIANQPAALSTSQQTSRIAQATQMKSNECQWSFTQTSRSDRCRKSLLEGRSTLDEARV